jgi:hypothetical protein
MKAPACDLPELRECWIVGNYSKIVVQRPKWRFRDILRSYAIHVDGRLRGTLMPGEELSLDVLPGRHVIRARVDWTGSPSQEIVVKRDSLVRVCVEPSGNALQLWKVFTRTGGITLSIEHDVLTALRSDSVSD